MSDMGPLSPVLFISGMKRVKPLDLFVDGVRPGREVAYKRLPPPPRPSRTRSPAQAIPPTAFKGADSLPGFAIRNHQTNPDGSVRVGVEFAPGAARNFRLEPINGQWKLAKPFLNRPAC